MSPIKLKSVVESSLTISEALDRIALDYGEVLTVGALSARLRRGGFPAASELVGKRTGLSQVSGKLAEHRARSRGYEKEIASLQAIVDGYSAAHASAPAARIIAPPKASKRYGAPVALWSDWHIAEKVFAEKVHNRNAYDLEIARKRCRRTCEGTRHLIEFNRRGGFEIREAVLWLGGDFISGMLHEELVETDELHPLEALVEARDMLVPAIRSVAEDVDRLIVPTNFGNHGRSTDRKRIKTAAENNYEWLLYLLIQEALADDKRIHVQRSKALHTYVGVFGKTLHFHHGDHVQYYGGSGGITIPLKKATHAWNKFQPADLHHYGHFHTAIDLGDIVVNGSMKGYDEYALSIKAEYEPAQQMFYMLDSKHGKTCVSKIWCD